MIVNKKISRVARDLCDETDKTNLRCEHNGDDDDYGDDFPPSVSPFDNFPSRIRTQPNEGNYSPTR